jgi:hypothetical protein
MFKRIFYFVFIFAIFINVSCASKPSSSISEKAGKNSEITTEESKENEEIILMFDDWKYKGFNNEYPLWAEFAIKNDISNLQKVLNITSEQKINIIIHSGTNIDQLIHKLGNELSNESELIQTWVHINPQINCNYNDYVAIKIILTNEVN